METCNMQSQKDESLGSSAEHNAKLTTLQSHDDSAPLSFCSKQNLITRTRQMVFDLLKAIEEHRGMSSGRESSIMFSQNNLKAFATSDAISIEKFRNCDGIRSLVMAVQVYAESTNVVNYGCQSLAALALHSSKAVDDMMNVGGVESILVAMKAQISTTNEDVKVSALKVLRNLTQTEASRKKIVSHDGLAIVVEMMTANMGSSRILSHSALILANLSFGSTEIKEAISKLGGLQAIAKGMIDHHDHQAMQARGSLALRNLLCGCDSNQSIAVEAGVINSLILAIKNFMEDREIVHQSCVALANVSNENEENRKEIVKAKGAIIIVRLMKKFPNSFTVSDDCISILRNIAVDNSDAQLEIGVTGGIACICQAIGKFSGENKLVTKAYASLRYLCFLQANRDHVAENNGIECIVEALKTNMSQARTVEHALLAVGNATFDHDESKAMVGNADGISVIIEAVHLHRLNPIIQEHGCRVLRNLADGCDLNRRLEIEHGGINVAIFAMIGYPDNASVQEQACAMLFNISQTESSIEAMMKADVTRIAEKAMSTHTKHRGVQLQAGSLLDRLNGFNNESADENPRLSRKESSIAKQRRKIKRMFSRN